MRKLNGIWSIVIGFVVIAMPTSLSAQENLMPYEGFYAGVDLGIGVGSSRYNTNSACALTPGAGTFCSAGASEINGLAVTASGTGKLSLTGGDVGAHIGYNWNSDFIVYGAELDFGWFNLDKFKNAQGLFPLQFLGDRYTLTDSINTNWLGTIRGRLGIVMSPALLLYITGGLALTDFEFTSSYNDNAIGAGFPGGAGYGRESKNKAGWVLGAGTEWEFLDYYSVKAEYLYIDFGSTNISVPTSNTPAFSQIMQINANLKANVIRLGLNYWF